MRVNTFGMCEREEGGRGADFRTVAFRLDAPQVVVPLQRVFERYPFVPSNPARLREDCYEAYNIQVQGLAKRIASSHAKTAVIGVSGGLDFHAGADRGGAGDGFPGSRPERRAGLYTSGLRHLG